MGGVRGKYFNQFTEEEIRIGYNSMIQEIKSLPLGHPIRDLFASAWIDFQCGKFLCIMIVLNYAPELIKERIFFLVLTPLNIARHRILGIYKKGVPSNLYQL
jgi:hypothetical protein